MLENLKSHADYQSENGVLFNKDCLEVFKLIEENSIDLITTDPPYPTIGRGSEITTVCHNIIIEQ